MTRKNYQPYVLLCSALACAAAALFLLPAGRTLPHDAFILTVLLAGAALSAFAYAAMQAPEPADADASLRPEVAWLSITGNLVPRAALEGPEPLLALVAEGGVPHPDMVAMLTPYFADLSMAFAQGATRYDGEGGVADAYRAWAMLRDRGALERATLNAAPLYGSGAVLSREAAREAYRPGDTWESLGMRLIALGYTGRFVAEPVVLAWAPENLSAMGALLVRQSRAALRALWLSARLSLPFAARVQYAAAAAGALSAWAAAAAAGLSALSLVFFNVGPVVLNSPGAWVGDAFVLLAAILAYRAWHSLAGVAPVYPMALAFAAAWRATYDAEYALATGPRAVQLWGGAVAAFRFAVATVRASGSAGTAPAGTPARS